MPIVPVFGPSSAVSGGGDMELIFSEKLTSSATSISTGTLPTGYRSLVIHTRLRVDGNLIAQAVNGYLNNDQTATNYQSSRDIGFNNAASSDYHNFPFMVSCTGALADAHMFGHDHIVIADHESTNMFKNWYTTESLHGGTGAAFALNLTHAGLWKDTAPVTSVQFVTAHAGPPAFVAGSAMFVYGLK